MATKISVGFAPSRRPEYYEIIRALKQVAPPSVEILEIDRSKASANKRLDVLVVSDADSIPVPDDARKIVRFWWNGHQEMIKERELPSFVTASLNVTFFSDELDQFNNEAPTVQVPYVFTAPALIRPPKLRRIGFLGEVDISDQIFRKRELNADQAIDAVDNVSTQITRGSLSLYEATNSVPDFFGVDPANCFAWKWALRNWIRWKLVQQLVNNFPRHVLLRGDDWVNLGFSARPTGASMPLRRFEYQRNWGSLDVGSKSSEDFYYPRTAEILAWRAGLLRFRAKPVSKHEGFLDDVCFSSADEMLNKAEEYISISKAKLNELNDHLQTQYLRLRFETSQELIRKIAQTS
jgi:hypothetical protein